MWKVKRFSQVLPCKSTCSVCSCCYVNGQIFARIPICLSRIMLGAELFNFWYRSFTFNSNKSPTWCNNFSVYYPDLCLQLNMFRASSRPSSGAQWLQWQPLILPSYRGDSRAVFVTGPAGRPARPRTHHDTKVKPEAATAVIERKNARNMFSCKQTSG